MDQGVIYFSHGLRHHVRLAVSLFTLREHYDGPITILETSSPIDPKVLAIARDPHVRASVQNIPWVQCRKHSAYVTKSTLWRFSPYERTVYLDSDTVVLAPIDDLFSHASYSGLVFTQFADWTTRTEIIRKRLEGWRNVKCESVMLPEALAESLNSTRPALNTGVFAYDRGRSQQVLFFLHNWEWLTKAGWKQFIADEIAAQILSVGFPHSILSDRWNYSPIYSRGGGAKIIHAHGSKHVLRDGHRFREGHALWWPHYERALAANVGELQEWTPEGDKYLAAYLAATKETQ